jgi:hypothetical protein
LSAAIAAKRVEVLTRVSCGGSDEIFDMVNPVKPGCITLDDLIRCGVGGTVVAMLVDLQGFYDYDNREVLIFSSK